MYIQFSISIIIKIIFISILILLGSYLLLLEIKQMDKLNQDHQSFSKSSVNQRYNLKKFLVFYIPVVSAYISVSENALKIQSEKSSPFFQYPSSNAYNIDVDITNSNKYQVSNIYDHDSFLKSSIILNDIYPKFQEFINSLSVEEILAFSGLLLNGLILNHTISIILVLYGDYLIDRFKLETRYPKLEKFIKLKKKLSSYSLKISFVWIFLCVLPQLYVYSFIIGIKLYQFIISNF